VTQEEAGCKYLARSNLLLQLHILENSFKVIQVLQSHGLKFTRATSDLADIGYSGVTLLHQWDCSGLNLKQNLDSAILLKWDFPGLKRVY